MYDFQSERWNEFKLPKLSLRELLTLTKLLGCPFCGSKEHWAGKRIFGGPVTRCGLSAAHHAPFITCQRGPPLCNFCGDVGQRTAVVSVGSFAAPILIGRAGPSTRIKFVDFFTVPIRNVKCHREGTRLRVGF